jgi:ADP-ribosylation factor family
LFRRLFSAVGPRRRGITVLGASGTGKTTLIRHWRGEPWLADPAPTGPAEPPATTTIRANGVELTAADLVDVGGATRDRDSWATRVGRGAHVLYLVDARALCGCLGWAEDRNLNRLVDDAARIGRWRRGNRAGRCVVVVTHTDADCRRPLLHREHGLILSEERYRDYLARQLAPLRSLLDADRSVPVVAGRLTDPVTAAALTADIMTGITGTTT